MKKEFYVYAHHTPGNPEPFYIGKGKNGRVRERSKRSSFWKSVVKKHGFEYYILHQKLSEEDALNLEANYIQCYGRRDLGEGPLVNLSDGWDNPPNHTGFIRSKETRRKISRSHIGMKRPWVTNSFKIGTHHSEVAKTHMRGTHCGKHNSMASPKNRQKVALSKIGRNKLYDLLGHGHYVRKEDYSKRINEGWKLPNHVS